MRKSYFVPTGVILLLLLSGCQHRWAPDPDLGKSVRGLAAAQYLNPNAPYGVVEPTGMDGPAAASTIESYQKSFEAPSSEDLGSVSAM